MNPNLWNWEDIWNLRVPQWIPVEEEGEYVGEIPTRKVLYVNKNRNDWSRGLNLEITEEDVQHAVAKFFNMHGEEVKPKKVFSTWKPVQEGRVQLMGISMYKIFDKEQLLEWINQSKKMNVDYTIGVEALEGMIW